MVGLRDRALIGLLVFTFARIGAAVDMTVRRLLAAPVASGGGSTKKGGKEHSMPCHNHLETYLPDYLEAAKIADDRVDALFRTTVRRTGVLTIAR